MAFGIMSSIPKETLDELAARYPDDEQVQALVKGYKRSEKLLRRSLYEFGAELRIEIEKYFGEPPLIPGTH
jgi:hypothetical protein